MDKWTTKPCPCGEDVCQYAMILPGIVTQQGVLRKEVADHIVNLHNEWVEKRIADHPYNEDLEE